VKSTRPLLRFLGLFAVAYLALAGVLFAMQARLVYLPGVGGRALATTPAAQGLAYEDVHLITEDGERLHGWWVPAREGPGAVRAEGAVVINAGNISHRMATLRIWHALGWNTFIFDYRGYGQSTGRPSEAGTYRDARAAWRHLTEERGLAGDRIVLFGRSLGAAVAARLATEVDPAGLIVESAFTSVPDLGAELYWWLPVRLLSRIRHPTAELLADVRAPVLVIHSPDDEIIPFHHGRALYRAARHPKEFLELTGSHNEGFLVMGDAYAAGLARFLARHVEPPGGWNRPRSLPRRGSPLERLEDAGTLRARGDR
jgi:uncharacterized protein